MHVQLSGGGCSQWKLWVSVRGTYVPSGTLCRRSSSWALCMRARVCGWLYLSVEFISSIWASVASQPASFSLLSFSHPFVSLPLTLLHPPPARPPVSACSACLSACVRVRVGGPGDPSQVTLTLSLSLSLSLPSHHHHYQARAPPASSCTPKDRPFHLPFRALATLGLSGPAARPGPLASTSTRPVPCYICVSSCTDIPTAQLVYSM